MSHITRSTKIPVLVSAYIGLLPLSKLYKVATSTGRYKLGRLCRDVGTQIRVYSSHVAQKLTGGGFSICVMRLTPT